RPPGRTATVFTPTHGGAPGRGGVATFSPAPIPMNNPTDQEDPFREQRRETGILEGEFQGEGIPMILR
ncbi:MAG: hypothetical protein GWO24_19790, partial [Akkermansiaceae bacterium]|nr:hypothetical protein [Akkermansiaceae bacterium]